MNSGDIYNSQQLRQERDNARRMVCRALYTDKAMQVRHAQLCGWDCFDNDPLDTVAKLDEDGTV